MLPALVSLNQAHVLFCSQALFCCARDLHAEQDTEGLALHSSDSYMGCSISADTQQPPLLDSSKFLALGCITQLHIYYTDVRSVILAATI